MAASDIVAILGVVIAALGLLIAIVKEWHHLVSAARATRRIVATVGRPGMSRRRFFGVTASMGAVAAFYVGGGMRFIRSVLLGSGRYKLPQGFVQNSRTGVLHHLSACKDHLPAVANRLNPMQTSGITQMHQGKKIHIAEIIAKCSRDEMAASILIDAIKSSPTSTHLYKYLIGIWGQKKEYDRIHQFLAANISYLEAVREQVRDNAKTAKRYTKALQDLQRYRARAEYLARINKVTSE